ncbi:prolipoprotein diacylglyceryl transferase [Caldicellulosiruptor changbaiensis]|uniref:Phosphatidylglycerol--prolipoprotein diacylglyceryl transferase n=1 Tax=Caldicellulosiruptor changbaiensis TaxID=1222016 RepID=A0A3T0D7K5_9FIRM|nr:prolipoprotein diacylglyceryl transferase [Caldicellulosiruptor changbaiensis]AZT91004.1 prolipoprotein diacylglyceryl transferase [Caldicellulosiruptor changbaiensis]
MYDNSIVFPGFHLKFNFSPIAFKIFGLEVRWYGIIIAFGFLCGFLVSSYIAKKENVQTEVLLDIAIIALPVAIIFARVYYVLFNFKEFKDNLLSIFAIRQGGLAIYGAVIGALVSTYIYCRTKKISFLKICDIGVHGLILGQAIGRWGNFANREAYGYETNLPWRMQIYSVEAGKRIEVHPTFLYESVWDFLVFFALLILRRYKKKDGEIFGFYLILYSAGRFFIEALRTDSLMLGPIRVSQLVAVICIIIGSTIVLKLRLQYFDKI